MLYEYIEKLYSVLPGCALFRLTGFYCPACGGTRAFVAFMQGHFIKSFYYHSIIDITALYVFYKLIHFVVFKIAIINSNQEMKEKAMAINKKTDIPVKGYLIVALVCTVIQWIIKNIMVTI